MIRSQEASISNTASGKPYPLGATLSREGVNFALYSKNAKEVFLLLFDESKKEPTNVIKIENCTRHIWHTFIKGIKAGQMYGYKVGGSYDPPNGMRFNKYKLLIDPYAKALSSKFINMENLLLAYDPTASGKDLVMDRRDNTAIIPKSIVVDDSFDWQGDTPPDIPFTDLIIYEVHLKGFTAHPSSGVKHPGTYLGFIEKIPYLKELGINAVEFLPLHEFYMEDFLSDKGLTNYWGYNTIGFFTPESSYASGEKPECQVREFKMLVRELHRFGIEVILDVVYNHSAEGSELGPTICFRGIDNPSYYCLNGTEAEPSRYYKNLTGCGNSLNLASPPCMRMVMDSLRYWVQEMHIDGFRFDLATALGRKDGRFDKSASFFDAISQDPILSRVKIIAEPWDIETYKVGEFPVEWSEWNGRFRDTVRRFTKGDSGQAREFGFRLTGSSDLFGDDGRHPYNSVNFITCHDGFTLNDLVSYNDKHNEANSENNRDGSDDNNAWNCGAEGETNDDEILLLRRQQTKNLLCCLFFSLGTPMLLGGDEFMRTQRGNNNAYCQDNDISWFNWEFIEKNREIHDFCKKAIAFRKQYPILQRKWFLLGKDIDGNNIPDISWFSADHTPPEWDSPELKTLCYRLDGADCKTAPGNYLLFFIFNASHEPQRITLPETNGKRWYRIIDTSLKGENAFLSPGKDTSFEVETHYGVNPRSTVVLIGK